jgi:hypothetical protein
MTESEWTSCTEPQVMLELLRERVSARKLRLFGCACVRQVWRLLPDEPSQRAVVAAEEFADGRRLRRQLAPAREAVRLAGRLASPGPEMLRKAARAALLQSAVNAANDTAGYVRLAVRWEAGDEPSWRAAGAEAKMTQSHLLRDLFGPLPFRAVTIDPAWLIWNDGTVKKLAEAAYEERSLPEGTLDQDRLAVLVDALEEAGVNDTLLLEHLRGPGPHVRGCFALDAILGKT